MIIAILLFAFFALLVSFMLYCMHHKWRYRSLRKMQAPHGLPIIGHLHYFFNFKSKDYDETDLLNTLLDIYKQNKNAVLDLGPCKTVLLCGDPNVTKFILTNPNTVKADEYQLIPWLRGGTFLLEGDELRQRIALFRQMVTKRLILDEFIEIFEMRTKILICKMNQTEGEVVDIWPHINDLTLDIFCETSVGISPNAQTLGTDYHKALEHAFKITTLRVASLGKQLDFLFPFTSDYKKYMVWENILNNFVKDHMNKNQEKADRQYEKESPKKTMMNFFLKSKLNGQNFTERQKITEINTFILGGSHTLVAALSFALYELATNPNVQEKVVEELRDIFGADKERPIEEDDFDKMDYLERVIKETLRLYPPLTLFAKNFTKDVEFEGITFPKGTTSMIFVYGMHRNPEFWENPEAFEPDRFLPENIIRVPSYAWLPFSGGQRMCYGQKYAFYEMKTVLTRILMNFELISPGKEFKPELNMTPTLHPRNGVNVIFQKRQWEHNVSQNV